MDQQAKIGPSDSGAKLSLTDQDVTHFLIDLSLDGPYTKSFTMTFNHYLWCCVKRMEKK